MQQQVSILDTLTHLFDYLVYQKKTPPSVEEIHHDLGAMGFQQVEIDKAMSWLISLNEQQDDKKIQAYSSDKLRLYSPSECVKISLEGRNLLDELVALGVIEPRLREIIIVNLMFLEEQDITAEEIKRIALMAIFNRKGQEVNAVWLERSLWEDTGVVILH